MDPIWAEANFRLGLELATYVGSPRDKIKEKLP